MFKRNPKVIVIIAVLLLAGLVFAVVRYKRRGSEPGNCNVITLTVWQTETDKGATQRLSETAAAFEQAHPCVKVKLESVAWSSLSAKLAVALQSHNEPDLTHLEPFMVAQLYSRDLLLPIDDVIEEIEKEVTHGQVKTA